MFLVMFARRVAVVEKVLGSKVHANVANNLHNNINTTQPQIQQK